MFGVKRERLTRKRNVYRGQPDGGRNDGPY